MGDGLEILMSSVASNMVDRGDYSAQKFNAAVVQIDELRRKAAAFDWMAEMASRISEVNHIEIVEWDKVHLSLFPTPTDGGEVKVYRGDDLLSAVESAMRAEQ